MKKVVIVILMFVAVSTANASDCVTKQEVLDAIDILVAKQDAGVSTTYAVCTPCSCYGYSVAGCYRWLASEAEEKEERAAKAHGTIDRFKSNGICK